MKVIGHDIRWFLFWIHRNCKTKHIMYKCFINKLNTKTRQAVKMVKGAATRKQLDCQCLACLPDSSNFMTSTNKNSLLLFITGGIGISTKKRLNHKSFNRDHDCSPQVQTRSQLTARRTIGVREYKSQNFPLRKETKASWKKGAKGILQKELKASCKRKVKEPKASCKRKAEGANGILQRHARRSGCSTCDFPCLLSNQPAQVWDSLIDFFCCQGCVYAKIIWFYSWWIKQFLDERLQT